MPNTDESKHWFIRITRPHSVLKTTLEEFWKKNKNGIVKCCFVLHIGSKKQVEHGHILIEYIAPVQRQTLAARWKSIWHVDRTEFQQTIWDGGLYTLQYCFAPKSCPEELWVKGFTREEIEEAKARAAAFQPEEASDDKRSDETPTKRNTHKTPTTNDVIDILANTIAIYDDMNGRAFYNKVVQDAIDVCNKHRIKFSEYSIRTIIDTAMARAGGIARARFANKVVEKYCLYLDT